MKSCVVIPARYASTRFPGKPLVPLLGKPMVLWVAELAAKAVGEANVFVATDDTSIASVVEAAGFNAIMTSQNALTGTDRVAEVAEYISLILFFKQKSILFSNSRGSLGANILILGNDLATDISSCVK